VRFFREALLLPAEPHLPAPRRASDGTPAVR
jgi:hypothetical protein